MDYFYKSGILILIFKFWYQITTNTLYSDKSKLYDSSWGNKCWYNNLFESSWSRAYASH